MKTPPDARQAARILKVLAVDTRVEIIRLLRGRTLCVNALAGRLGVTQGAVSQHLRIMRDAGLVVDEKRGYSVHYRLDNGTLAAWRAAIKALLEPTTGVGHKPEGGTPCAAVRRRKTARSRKS